MFFATRLSLGDLIQLCRNLRHQSAAGVSLVKVFSQQAERGPARLRTASNRIAGRLQNGDAISDAVHSEKDLFPPIMLAMIQVGDETGTLPEIFGALEDYFRRQQQLKRQFWAQSFLPIIQIIFAFFIIALLIVVLGIIGESRGTSAPSILGVKGVGGAGMFLGISLGVMTALFFLARWTIQRSESGAALSAFLLRVPKLGGCLQALAVGRFAFAMHLTLNTATPAAKALRLSFQAAGNAALQQCANAVIRVVKSGKEISLALTRCKYLPEEFVNMTAVGEAGGRLPEVMEHQAEHYQEEAGRRMKTMSRTVSFAIWMLYAAFMIVAIFRIANMYLSKLGV